MASRLPALDHDGERVTFDVKGETTWAEPGAQALLVRRLTGARLVAPAGINTVRHREAVNADPVRALAEMRVWRQA
jgi:hypothetical protein